jgi:hypothetical protein
LYNVIKFVSDLQWFFPVSSTNKTEILLEVVLNTMNQTYLYESLKQEGKWVCASFSDLFHSKCKLISYLPTMNIYCVYDAKSKTAKLSFFFSFCLFVFFFGQIVILIIFNGVLYHIKAYIVTVSYFHSTWIRFQKNLLVRDDIYKCITKIYPVNTIWSDLLCLTPISAIFQLYHGNQF